MGREKANDEMFFKSIKKRFFKINLETMNCRDSLDFTFTCLDCSNHIQVVGYHEIAKVQKHNGLCPVCYEKFERTKYINLISSTDIKNFLDSLFKKNLIFFKDNSLVYEKLIPIFHQSKISKKDFSLIFNIWFETTFSAKKILSYCKLFNYQFFVNDNIVGDVRGNLYYPLEGFKRYLRPCKLKTSVVAVDNVLDNNEPQLREVVDNFTITEVGPDERFITRTSNYESAMAELEIFLKDDTFQNLLKDKLSTILAEKYADEIFNNDFKIKG